jgi:hypothetical protein
VALSLLYLAFLRTIQILILRRSDDSDLAIEVVVLRHEVAVLLRQVARPALPPQPKCAALAKSENVDPSHIQRSNRLAGLVHEYRLVA